MNRIKHPAPAALFTETEDRERLRDSFAGQAMAALIAADGGALPPEAIAAAAYRVARAMLVERERHG